MYLTKQHAKDVVSFWLKAGRRGRMELIPREYHGAIYDIVDGDDDWLMLLTRLEQVVYKQHETGLSNFLEVGYQVMQEHKDSL